ncbi:hypothetical protein LINGRAHAP2_LOCUS7798 [Linum grandiflorum]
MWINIHNLPPIYKLDLNIEIVGNMFFRRPKCDRPGMEQGRWMSYIRVLVEVQIGELHTNEKELLEFTFKKVTDYCLYCGRMGHSASNCESREKKINGGGVGNLPCIYEYSIRAGSAPKDLFGGLDIQISPTATSISPSTRRIHTNQLLETRGRVDPTSACASSIDKHP